MRKKPNFKKQFRGVTIEYKNGFVRVSVNFKEPKDSNSVWLDINEKHVTIYRTTRNGGQIINEFDYW